MIITTTPLGNLEAAYLSSFPDQFKTDKYKTTNTGYIKQTMDYFANRTYAQYVRNCETFVKNYDLLKGVLRPDDYYNTDTRETQLFIQALTKELKLPAHVKHYPILNPPVNEMIGGLSKKRSTFKAKALDSQSKSEEMTYKTQLMWELIMDQAKASILRDLKNSGQLDQIESIQDPNQQQQAKDQVNQQLQEKVQSDLIDYTSMAERWSNHIMIAGRVEFGLKEISEEMLRDLLTSSRMFALVDEDNSAKGFNVEWINPKNVCIFTTQDKKYTKDAYAVSIVNIMEISEVIEKFDLTKEEIDHLRTVYQNYGVLNNVPTNYGGSETGAESIMYTHYSPLIEQERMIIAAEMDDNTDVDDIRNIIGLASPNPGVFGYKYIVVRSYWISKKLVKKVTYTDPMGIEKTVLADENYKNGTIPTEISVEEGWVNQMFKGVKIGYDIYKIEPFNLLPYIPVVGGVFDTKNSPAASLVDMMKPFQILYNIVVNQLYSLLAKDKGKVIDISRRKVPVPKDGDPEDAVDIMMEDAKIRGLIIEDDSPENLKAPSSNTNLTRAIDLDLSQSIQTRILIAKELKEECWGLVGFTKQRLSSPQATETATANQNSLNISYTQTEPYYIQHRYVMNQLYQAIVDASQYIESSKPTSTLSYLNDQGENAFIQVTQRDIKGRDINVYVTSSDDDNEVFAKLQSLSQAVIQNNGTLYEVSQMYTTHSLRQLQKVLKEVSDRRLQIEMENIQLQQNTQQVKQQQIAAQLQQKEIEADKQRQFEAWQNDLERLNKREVALLMAFRTNPNALADTNHNGVADALELTAQQGQVDQIDQANQIKQQQVDTAERKRQDTLLIELQKIATERERTEANIKIAQMELNKSKISNSEK